VRARIEALGLGGVELVAGSGGVFEITVDGELRFSKRSLGRFPTDEEIEALLGR
jgi:selT/selW/selH-like putative selenoprotein